MVFLSTSVELWLLTSFSHNSSGTLITLQVNLTIHPMDLTLQPIPINTIPYPTTYLCL